MILSEYDDLCRLLRERSGLALLADKQYLVESRLQPVADRFGLDGLSMLIGRLKAPNAEGLIAEVVEAMTTKETLFFRDKIPFESFRNVMMPALMAARAAERRIRIWCAAAATGQEPYSLAIALTEMGGQLDGWRVEIVATDISNGALEKAKSGIYSQFEVQRGLPIQLLIKYFQRTGETWQIAPELHARIQFRQLNLLDYFGHLGTFDIVFCRNVLIYFDVPTKTAVLDRLARVMAGDGYLVLGGAETVMGLTEGFDVVADQPGIYTPRAAVAGAVKFRLLSNS